LKDLNYVKPKNALTSVPFRTSLGERAYSATSDPLAEISNILFEIITEINAPGKSNSELVTPNFRMH